MSLSRREFVTVAAGGFVGAYLAGARPSQAAPAVRDDPSSAKPFSDLLKTWCDGLLTQQINDTADLKLLGALRCPACGVIHGRCHDALYPMMHLAHTTGDSRYLDSAIKLQAWSDNVTLPTGEFTNDLDPKSWKGITVFATIALGDALQHHGHLLDKTTRTRWLDRLSRAAKFLDGWMTIETGNINYPLTSSLAFTVAGEVLSEKRYLDRGREFAQHALKFFTPNHLLFGENHPADIISPKGCRAVDLGYNVEETLPALALYAMRTKDQPVLDAAVKSLQSHMEFMLPDGAWDNSWGTRDFKWTYWGSRTSDGCFPAYALLADRDPRFAEVARRNLALMQSCTHDGLLYGGPHLQINGDLPCVHHTFTHAKSLATVLDAGGPVVVSGSPKLPRDEAYGVKPFDEIRTRLVAVGPWRATITDYDIAYYKAPTGGHASGGAMTLLYHMTLGPICVAGMTEYALIEANNQQKHGNYPTMPLAPRIELRGENAAFTSLSDLAAQVSEEKTDGGVRFTASGRLVNPSAQPPPSGAATYRVSYTINEKTVTIRATAGGATGTALIVPVVSPRGDTMVRLDDRSVRITKPSGSLVIRSSGPSRLLVGEDRVFNLVPGMQCLAIEVPLDHEQGGEIALEELGIT